MAEAMRANVGALLKGIDRYNPENLATLERYIDMQARENVYDLEANLAVLKLYQFNPMFFQASVAAQILLKALTNLPHTDFTLCKCLIDYIRLDEEPLKGVVDLADLLETCNFRMFWNNLKENPELIIGITGFEDSIRKFVCHVVGITYQTINKDIFTELLGGIPDYQVNQWIAKYGWKEMMNREVFISNQDENIKTKNIRENITFDTLQGILAKAPATR
eukprot:GHVU01214692.1.p1 GENE.GHVU01214692.1~~GHVU01214692.1.p1  ORF type:complete len:230 (+),score=37.27 GHVU01214692.1:33-692(+)